MDPIKVVVAISHKNYRRAAEGILRDDSRFQLVGSAVNADDASSLIINERADLLLIDLRIDGGFGMELCRAARAAGVVPVCLIANGESANALRVEAILAGAAGALEAGFTTDEVYLIALSTSKDSLDGTSTRPSGKFGHDRSAVTRIED